MFSGSKKRCRGQRCHKGEGSCQCSLMWKLTPCTLEQQTVAMKTWLEARFDLSRLESQNTDIRLGRKNENFLWHRLRLPRQIWKRYAHRTRLELPSKEFGRLRWSCLQFAALMSLLQSAFRCAQCAEDLQYCLLSALRAAALAELCERPF